jgi:NAD-dependent SIR2 family protein deacetylase
MTYQRVYFLGAGASHVVGVPLTGQLLVEIWARAADGSLYGKRKETAARNRRARRRLREFLLAVFPSLGSDSSLPNVTDVFSLLDHWIGAQEAPGGAIGPTDLAELRLLLERATLWLIAQDRRKTDAKRRLADFYEMLAQDGLQGRRTCVITTNYDRVVERALLQRLPTLHTKGRLDHGVEWRDDKGTVVPRPMDPAIGLLKLHGSTTWLACPVCQHVYIRPHKSIYSVAYWDRRTKHSTCHCKGDPALRAVVVAPSLARGVALPAVNSVWLAALEALRGAREWIFVGYSLPTEDIAIRSLLIRAYHGHVGRRPKTTVVLARQGADAIASRFEFLLPGCAVKTDGFLAHIDDKLRRTASSSSK